MTSSDHIKIEQSFSESVCAEISLSQSGLDRFIVNVPFVFEDGDHFAVLLRKEGDSWLLSDEGHTFMHISYDIPQFERGHRWDIVEGILVQFGLENRNGELVLAIPNDSYGDAFFTYIQALTRISDITFLTQERVRNTFADDLNSLVESTVTDIGLTLQQNYHHPEHDPEINYPIDVFINGTTERPIFVFGVGNDNQCRDATIIINRWESWNESFHSVAIFRDLTEINRVVSARFSDVVGRQFSNIDGARQRFPSYLADISRLRL